jgi:hypothetical protein
MLMGRPVCSRYPLKATSMEHQRRYCDIDGASMSFAATVPGGGRVRCGDRAG